MRYFKVLHDFVATDAVELSVKKGDLVCAFERIEQDGWLKVELASDTRKRGFVPVTYVREVPSPAPSQPPQAQTPVGGHTAAISGGAGGASQTQAVHSFTTAALQFGERASAGSAPPSPLHVAYAHGTATSLPPRGSGTTLGAGVATTTNATLQEPAMVGSTGTFLANPNAVVEAFIKNEIYFKQLMKQRQDTLAKLESGVAEALADIAACKDKNSILARKLRDLDTTIEKERKKWKERVEEEKLLVQRASANTMTSANTFTVQQRSLSQISQTLRTTTASTR